MRLRTALLPPVSLKKGPYYIHEEEVTRSACASRKAASVLAGAMGAFGSGWGCESKPVAAKARAASSSIKPWM